MPTRYDGDASACSDEAHLHCSLQVSAADCVSLTTLYFHLVASVVVVAAAAAVAGRRPQRHWQPTRRQKRRRTLPCVRRDCGLANGAQKPLRGLWSGVLALDACVRISQSAIEHTAVQLWVTTVLQDVVCILDTRPKRWLCQSTTFVQVTLHGCNDTCGVECIRFISWPISHHSVWSVITAHKLCPLKLTSC